MVKPYVGLKIEEFVFLTDYIFKTTDRTKNVNDMLMFNWTSDVDFLEIFVWSKILLK